MPATHTDSLPAWTLDGLVAHDRSCTLDLAVPADGITLPSDAGLDHLLGIDLRVPAGVALTPVDSWLRGDDVVAVYRPHDPRRLEATAMWRRLSKDHRAWELILSAQTALVESDGSLAVTCDIRSGDITLRRNQDGEVSWGTLNGSSACPEDTTSVLIRRESDAVLIAGHPTDARRIVLTRDTDRVRIDCWLFPAAIEKGVLHRGRVLAAIGPRDVTTWADAIIEKFAASPPPLTT